MSEPTREVARGLVLSAADNLLERARHSRQTAEGLLDECNQLADEARARNKSSRVSLGVSMGLMVVSLGLLLYGSHQRTQAVAAGARADALMEVVVTRSKEAQDLLNRAERACGLESK